MLLDQRTIIIVYVPKGNSINFVSTPITTSNLYTYYSSHNLKIKQIHMYTHFKLYLLFFCKYSYVFVHYFKFYNNKITL